MERLTLAFQELCAPNINPKRERKERSTKHILHGRDRAQRFRRHIKPLTIFSYSLNTNRIQSTQKAAIGEKKTTTHAHINTRLRFDIYTIHSLVHFYVCFIFFGFVNNQ